MSITKYHAACVRTSVSAFLAKLGVTVDPRWDDEYRPVPKPEPLEAGHRFRRTREEMQQLEEFTEWQRHQREIKRYERTIDSRRDQSDAAS